MTSWDSILIVGLACSAGMIAGVVIGWLVAPLAGMAGDKVRKASAGLLVLIGAAAGYAFLPGVIAPFVEPRLDDFAAAPSGTATVAATVTEEIPAAVVDQAIASALTTLNDPFLDAVLEREPSRADQVMTRLASAYRRGGEEALYAALLEADQEVLQVSFP